jgi:hypothetical protein
MLILVQLMITINEFETLFQILMAYKINFLFCIMMIINSVDLLFYLKFFFENHLELI